MSTTTAFRTVIRRAARKNSVKTAVPSSKGRLAQSLQPTGRAKKLGSLHVAPRSRPSFSRDAAPHSGKRPKQQHSNPLEEHFDLSTTTLPKTLPSDFTSPPLLPGLLQSVKEVLGQDAVPTPIQALSLKHLMKEPGAESKWKEYLLASETGSGKSMAYLLPLLQDLKRTELESAGSPRKSSPRPFNPRALVLAPTHELSRQLAGFAKKVSHIIKLRIQCASRANTSSTTKNNSTASKMKTTTEVVFDNCDTGDVMVGSGGRFNREVDVLVGTPMKLLELEKGKGWNWEQRAHERALRAGSKKTEDPTVRKFWVDEPEMGLESIEWVIVDEADVLFDPDFEASTRQLLADIATAKGQPVPVLPVSPVSLSDARPTPESPQAISYPFHLLLTSATIPNSLSNYLSTHHPALVRLASPKLHHLPSTLRTEHAKWTGGNKDADIERRIRRVWAEDALTHAKSALPTGSPVKLSKIIVFCNKRSKVEQLTTVLGTRGVACVALTGDADARKRGNNHHLDGFLKSSDSSMITSSSRPLKPPVLRAGLSNPAVTPHVLVTTSLLSRGLDFSPEIKHVFIVDEPRNMIDFLHRAGRAGRAGESGKVVVFGRAQGRGSGRTEEMRKKIRALT
ncbi:P-loop containing nucleoside triphosphate hydrolase protein [Boletus reticuloceps]|uniref:RNA helicase n=1 Tax=Boletus reticuloceps TaxID=495285 RepID=A0A8I3ACF8_9AGAM|nr:P-loop containing nucleoside triphosphate hydrolase protein [Boletus reticuloceps]